MKDARGEVLEREVLGHMQESLGMTGGDELLMISKSQRRLKISLKNIVAYH